MTSTDSAVRANAAAPLIAHVVHRFDYGGLENGIVNIINTMDSAFCRHAVIALTEATAFADRITRRDTTVHSLGKRPGKDIVAYLRLWALLRSLRPTILHTRNIGTLDCSIVGRLAGVRLCLHGEHGWDMHDPDGTNPRYRRLRLLFNPLVTRFITVSEDLARWLIETVGIHGKKVTTICNGVDTQRFRPAAGDNSALPARLHESNRIVIGTVIRFQEIKDPLMLVRAWILAREILGGTGVEISLAMIGDGPLRTSAAELLQEAGYDEVTWLPGMCDNVPALMRSFDVFVLPSRREGISNTILEALASGLPVIATRTGGNPELVEEGACGCLVPPESPEALADAIAAYARDTNLRQEHGRAARERAERKFSLATMAAAYQSVYADALKQQRR